MEKQYIVKEVFKSSNEEERFKLICEAVAKIVKQNMNSNNNIDKVHEEMD